MKKAFSLILSVIIIITSVSCLAYADNERIDYLILGDSIAEGYGIVNRSEGCYGRIIADTNNYNYLNFGVTGYTSYDLLYDLDSYSYIISEAEIISISIGGNDYFNTSDVVLYALCGLTGLGSNVLDKVADHFYDNLCIIMSTIRELNPDALVLLQTVGNTWYGIGSRPYGAGTSRINDRIKKYASEHPDDIEIVDIASVLTGHKEYVAADTVHPNAAGNVAIAKAIQEKLVELGYADSTELVILNPGEDYDYFDRYYGGIKGKVLEAIIHILLGYPVF